MVSRLSRAAVVSTGAGPLAAAVLLASCGKGSPTPPEVPHSVDVVVSTTGADADPDGYTVTLGTDQRSVGPDASVSFDDLAPGAYEVSLSGLAPNCEVADGTTRSATVTETQGASVLFEVVCESVLVHGAFVDAVCPDLSLQATSASPLDLIAAGSVPGDLESPLFAYVTADGSDDATVSVVDRLSDGSVSLVAPYHPSGSMDGGDVSIRFAGGTHACPAVTFTVESLPSAPGELGAVADLLQQAVEVQAGLAGTTVAELKALDGSSVPSPSIIPLLIAQSVIDHPDNPSSLRAVADGTAPGWDASALEALDRVLAGMGLRAELEAALSQAQPAPAPTSEGGPARVDAIDCLGEDIDTPLELSDCMDLAADARFRLDGVSGRVLTDLGTATGVLGLVPNAGVKLAASGIGGAAFALQKLREGTANLLPSELTAMELTATPVSFLEDQEGPGSWTANVLATSAGWELDQSVLELLLQVAGGLSSYDAWLTRFADGDVLGDVADYVVNQVVSKVIASSGGAGILTIAPESFGPVDVSAEEWSDRNLIPEVALAMTSHTEYEPKEPGSSVLSVRTKDGKFGHRQVDAQETLTVEAIQVTIFPTEVTLAPGETQTFIVHVVNALHPDSVDLDPDVTLAGSAQIAYAAGDSLVVSYTAPPTPTEPDVLSVVHTAQGGARGFSDQKREASATINFAQLELLPVLECVEPGDTVQLEWTGAGVEGEPLTWTASAGDVTDGGLFTAPSQPATVQITVALQSNPDIQSSITVTVGPCACQFTIQVGGAQTYVGQPGDVAEFFAFNSGDPAHPWAIGSVTLTSSSGRTVTFGLDIGQTLATVPGSYDAPEIGGDLGSDGVPYATYGEDQATLQVHEIDVPATLVGEVLDGVVRDANDPEGPPLSISATFNIYPPEAPFYGTASCQIAGPGG